MYSSMGYKGAVAIVLVTIAVSSVHTEDGKYTTKYDEVDVDEILNNKRLLVPFVDCILDKGPCTVEGTLLKEIIPEALLTDCEKCSAKQRKGGSRVLKQLFEKEQHLFKKLEAKFDPEGKYREQYKAEAAKEGVTI